MDSLRNLNLFRFRHIGPSSDERDQMLELIGVKSLEGLIDKSIPPSIRLKQALELPPAESEHEYTRRLNSIASANKIFRSYIGLGYHDTVTPSVLRRLVLENPGWYTPYTPYQAEIAQGRLESLLNFQTMVSDLTGMEVSNASLLDEATAAAEGMSLLYRVNTKQRSTNKRRICLVSDRCFPQVIEVLLGRAEPLDIDIRVQSLTSMNFDSDVFGVIVQYPDSDGVLEDARELIRNAHDAGALVAVGTDLLALSIVTPPGEMGADVVFGNSQRFGVPLGYGGPHAAFFATRKKYVREMPGRIIGVSVDTTGQTAYRMALATREQHIRREKAKSNICTSQALLANMAAMYAIYHGPEGLKAIASRIHMLTRALDLQQQKLGLKQKNHAYFDTLRVEMSGNMNVLKEKALAAGINFRYFDDKSVGISLNETVEKVDLQEIVGIFAETIGVAKPNLDFKLENFSLKDSLPDSLCRSTTYLEHPVFNRYHSETEMMRYVRKLEKKDIGLDTSMIPLGSCTVKLNSAAEMLPITWDRFSQMHPWAPTNQCEGYSKIIKELEVALKVITGFSEISLQPNSGAQGEFAGLMVIRAYHKDRGDGHRDVVLIPASAHGTNPASAAMAGLRVLVVASAEDGSIDVNDLRQKAEKNREHLACLMVTYPSTHGVFEDSIKEICSIVHDYGGQVYMDGANMNAQVGLTSPSTIGADVCHLNLHKTFAIPHGGGGPGMGPIGVSAHLQQYLPGHPLAKIGGVKSIHSVSGAPWGSASILIVSHAYIRMLGSEGITEASRYAILNANYIKARLKDRYPVLYTRSNGLVAHELIFDLRSFKSAGINETDIAKRLMDYGFHAPTMSFPVAGTIMVEPTESESKAELDRFCDAMLQIRNEIEEVLTGKADKNDNVLKNAPHTASAVCSNKWSHGYSREEAAFPLPFVRANKFWPSVERIDNSYGDRNLFCSCPPIEG